MFCVLCTVNRFSPTHYLIVTKLSLRKRSASYLSNPPFLIFDDIRALRAGRQSVRMSKKLKMVLDQYGAEHFEV